MDIATSLEHKALAYLAEVNARGARPSLPDLTSYVQQAAAQKDAARSMGGLSLMFGRQPPSSRAYHAMNMLAAAGWVERDADGGLVTSTLGRAVLQSLNERENSMEDSASVFLDRDDPLSYAAVILRLAELGPELLLIDPYFRLPQLSDIFHRTGVTRVLTSDKLKRNELEGLAVGVELLIAQGGKEKFEVRVSDAVHDRYFIPASGAVTFLGTSLNGVGRHAVTVMGTIHDPVAEHVRRDHERMWKKANRLPKPPSGSDSPPPVPEISAADLPSTSAGGVAADGGAKSAARSTRASGKGSRVNHTE